jgi:ATP-dependent Lhr-like helicase
VHHGSLSKEIRVQMEDDFKSERLKALICTSSLELGIDVGSADFTIQFDSPRQVTRLIQRVGRSGHRVGETSVGKIIATDPVEIAESLVISRRAMIEELEKLRIRPSPFSVLANQLVAMTLTESRVDKDQAFAIVTKAYPFKDLLRKDFEETADPCGPARALERREGFPEETEREEVLLREYLDDPRREDLQDKGHFLSEHHRNARRELRRDLR